MKSPANVPPRSTKPDPCTQVGTLPQPTFSPIVTGAAGSPSDVASDSMRRAPPANDTNVQRRRGRSCTRRSILTTSGAPGAGPTDTTSARRSSRPWYTVGSIATSASSWPVAPKSTTRPPWASTTATCPSLSRSQSPARASTRKPVSGTSLRSLTRRTVPSPGSDGEGALRAATASTVSTSEEAREQPEASAALVSPRARCPASMGASRRPGPAVVLTPPPRPRGQPPRRSPAREGAERPSTRRDLRARAGTRLRSAPSS